MLRIFHKTNIYKLSTNHIRTITGKTMNREEKLTRRKHQKILEEKLELTRPQTNKLLRNLQLTYNNRQYKMLNTIKKLQKLGFNNNDIYKNPQCLNLTDSTVDNYVCYLRDVGIKDIDVETLLNFKSILKKPVTLLKLHGTLPDKVRVIKRLCLYLDPNLNEYSLLYKIDENHTILSIHEVIFKTFIVSLGTVKEEADRLYKSYIGLKYKSVSLMSETRKFLLEEMGFDNKKILQHLYLLETHPKSVKKIIRTFRTLGGLDIRQVLYKTPKLMTIPVENFKEILKYFETYRITDEAIQKCYDIFTLSPDTILIRLQDIEKTPEFKLYLNNPRLLSLILTQNKAKLRLELLKNQNFKCSSLHLLCSSNSIFDRYTQEGNDRTNGTDIINYLHEELNVSIQTLRESLNGNPNWYHVPFLSVNESLNYLLTKGFTTKDISSFPIILLYKKEQLQDILIKVDEKLIETNKTVCMVQTLNLCLYLLEKPYYFSGNGLWGVNNNNTNVKKTITVK